MIFTGLAQGSGRSRATSLALLAGSLALAACGTASSQQRADPTAFHAHSASQTQSASLTAKAPAGAIGPAAGFRVLSMTFVSDQRGFALGAISCTSGRCLALLGTTNGGASWRRLTAPTRRSGGVYDTCPHSRPCVLQVRFATPLIGYAFDPSLLVTTDGGRHWQQLRGKDVNSLEAANGTVVRVARSGFGCAGQPYQVQSAPIGTTNWQRLAAPPIGMICPPVLYRQDKRMVLVGYGNPAGGVRATALIDRSGDGGQTWASGPDRCGGRDGYASGVALAPPDVLVLLCQHQIPRRSGGFGPAWIRVSTDGGASFGPDQLVPSLARGPTGLIVRYQVAATSAGRVLIAETGTRSSKILLSENGGRSWPATLSLPGSASVLLVGYQDLVTARVAQSGMVWTTHNGGRTWTAHQFSA